MASKKVSALKVMGTVSLGLLTGVSYSLSSLAVPAILTLPSASSASKAFHSLMKAATPHLSSLSFLSSGSFALAFVLSPRTHRHPYLLYSSLLSLASAFSPRIATLVLGSASTAVPPPTRASRRKVQTPPRNMEASYEVVGDVNSESTASSEAADEESVNGEGVRGEVENYLKARVVQTSIAAVGFMISIVGIWGDGAAQVFGNDVIIL